MTVDLLSQSTLKITLTPEDMCDFNLKYEKLDRPEENRKLVSKLMSALKRQSPDTFSSEAFSNDRRLFVEAFPKCDGGCMLYVSSLMDSKGLPEKTEVRQLVCFLDSIVKLERLCRLLNLEKKYSGIRFSSDLYMDKTGYRLVVTPCNVCHKRLRRFLSEYGVCSDSELDAAFTKEHCKLLAENTAAELLGECDS